MNIDSEDNQSGFALWPEQDPNLEQLGIYKASISLRDLRRAVVRSQILKRQAETLIWEISSTALTIWSRTNDDKFGISIAVPLLSSSVTAQPCRFYINSISVQKRVKYADEIKFELEYDRPRKTLLFKNTWYCHKLKENFTSSFSMEATEADKPDWNSRTDQQWLTQVNGRILGEQIRVSTNFLSHRSKTNRVLISNGYIVGGRNEASTVVASCANVSIGVPHEHGEAIAAYLQHCAGAVELFDTPERFLLRSGDSVACWVKEPVPNQRNLLNALDRQPIATVRCNTEDVQKYLGTLAALFTDVMMNVDGREEYKMLRLWSITHEGRKASVRLKIHSYTIGDDENADLADIRFNAADLWDAVSSIRTAQTDLVLMDFGMVVSAVGGECHKHALLKRQVA